MHGRHVERDTGVGDFRAWGLPAWDFDVFHREELPWRLAEGAVADVAWDLAGAPPLAIALTDGRAYTYAFEDETVRIEPGIRADAVCALEMDEGAWQAHVVEFRTVSGLVLSQSVRFLRGDLAAWDAWAPALRRLYSGRPIYNPDETLLDAGGTPLDLHRKFTLDDDQEEMAHFLNTAGYIVVRGAMAHLRDRISDEIDRMIAETTEGNIYSWWVDNETTGERFPYRLLYVSERSALVRSLMDDDPVIRTLAGLTKSPLVPVHDRMEGALCVLKPFRAGEELAPSIAGNLGWHTDCGLGGCPITCPAVNIGIHLDGSGEDRSRLWALAGSRGRSIHDALNQRGVDMKNAIPLDTEPGDVTVHFTCLLHAGPPPSGNGGRRSLYLPFYAPETLRLLGPYQGFQQILPGFGTGSIPSVANVAKELTA